MIDYDQKLTILTLDLMLAISFPTHYYSILLISNNLIFMYSRTNTVYIYDLLGNLYNEIKDVNGFSLIE